MGSVYLMCDANSNLYKIGVTGGSIEMRMKKLQTGNGNEIHIVDHFESNKPFRLEKILHKVFKEKRQLNEWFLLTTDDVLNFKETCKKYEDLFERYEEEKKKIL